MNADNHQQLMINATDVVKNFATGRAVDDINRQVARGDTFAFLGPNGAGKTTTVKMLTTLLRPDAGKIMVDNIDIAANPTEARRRFGVVFQECTLDPKMTVHENLWAHGAFYDVPKIIRKQRIEEVLETFDVADRAKHFVGTLSGGLKRRIEIARAILHKPALIFLDEPTLGLDPQSRRMMWEQIGILQKVSNTTIFLTTHYLDEVEKFAQKVAVIRKGKILMQGTPQSIMAATRHDSLEEAFVHLTRDDNQQESES